VVDRVFAVGVIPSEPRADPGGFGDLGWDNRQNEFGSFVRVTERATEKTWTWRVGEAQAIADAPAVAFSPDGRKLTGTVKQPSAGSILNGPTQALICARI